MTVAATIAEAVERHVNGPLPVHVTAWDGSSAGPRDAPRVVLYRPEALILDEHMAYSSAYWTSDDPGYTLADAQADKLARVCRKVGLDTHPGMRLLDVGCVAGARWRSTPPSTSAPTSSASRSHASRRPSSTPGWHAAASAIW